MQTAPSLQLKQSTQLVMTQQLQQSIKLLQLNAMELSAFIATEFEKNPFLQEGEAEEVAAVPEKIENQTPVDEAPTSVLEFEGESFDISGGYDYTPSERITIVARNKEGDLFEHDEVEEKKPTLREHLITQLHMSVADHFKRRVAEALIDLVDEAGYIREPLANTAAQLGTAESLLEELLGVIQGFDPVGVGARNLAECLGLQLREKDRLDPAMEILLANIELLGQGKAEVLRKKCGVDADDFASMIADIKSLNPKPGLTFECAPVQAVEPDVIVKRTHEGAWRVELSPGSMPRVLVNRQYIGQIAPKAQGADKKFITEHIGNANWLVKALDQRANTILKVATELVAEQEGFFRLGIHYLKPLTLKDIAAATGFHESTISRVTTGKYMMTPRGLFELKYFFTSSVSHNSGGEDVSSQTVKHMIKELIDSEDAKHPLSDDEIAERLSAKGVQVARRTVAKYREALLIPSSTGRRRRL